MNRISPQCWQTRIFGSRSFIPAIVPALIFWGCLADTSIFGAEDAEPKQKAIKADPETFAFPDEESGSLSFPDTAPNYVDKSMVPTKDEVDRASGVDGRIGFIGLPAFGRDDSIAPVELFPYLQMNNQILFGDIRGFVNTKGKVGANLGMGYRFIEPSDTALFGINGFYDADDSTGRSFQQLSVGWEARMQMAGLFGNIYMPVSTTEKTLAQAIVNERFDDNNVLFDVRSRIGKAMTGLDLNVQSYLPGDFLEEHQVQATAGWYHFQGGAGVDDINGYKLGLQGYITPAVGTMTQLTHDNSYGTNFNIGVFWRFGTRELPGISLHGQLRRFVDRNYNVILAKRTTVDTGVVAHNADGSVLVVQHVGDNTGTGTGTASDPYTTLQDAQNDPQAPNVIYVHSGAVVNDSIVLQDGQSLVGEGSVFKLRDDRYGFFNLPGTSGGSGSGTPQIFGSGGDAITMGNNSQVVGVNVIDSVGRGIVADNVSNIRISNVKVIGSTGDGVYVNHVSDSEISNLTVSSAGGNGITIMDIDDTLDLSDIYVQDIAGEGIHIEGGLGVISFTDDLIIRRTAQAAFSVSNMERLTEVDDQGTTSTLDDVTTYTPSIVSVQSLVVRNAGGGYGAGISTTDNEGLIGFGEVDIETQGAASVYSRNDNALLIGNGILNSIDAPVADVEGSSIKILLTEISADGGAVGMRFKDSTGSFAVYGDGKNSSSGGVIKNTDVGISVENAGSVALQTVDFTDNGKLAVIDGGAGLIIAGSTVTGTTDTFIDATNLTSLQVYQSTFTNNTISSNMGIRFVADTVGSFTASVSNNLVTAMPGTFFSAQTLAGGETSSLTYAFQSNAVELSSVGGIAADLNWNGSVLAYATSNTIVGSQAGQTAFRLATGDSTTLGMLQANQNLVTFSGVNSIGLDITAQSPVNVYADSNEFRLQGANQTAMRLSLGKAAAVGIADNTITDYAGGGTGILFTTIEDGSQIALDNNTIDLSRFSTFVDRGIIVSALTAADGDPPKVSFYSTSSNTITGATATYSFPATGLIGRVLINNAAVVFP